MDKQLVAMDDSSSNNEKEEEATSPMVASKPQPPSEDESTDEEDDEDELKLKQSAGGSYAVLTVIKDWKKRPIPKFDTKEACGKDNNPCPIVLSNSWTNVCEPKIHPRTPTHKFWKISKFGKKTQRPGKRKPSLRQPRKRSSN